MVDVFLISKTELTHQEKAPIYKFVEIGNNNIRDATEEEIKENSSNIYFVYEADTIMSDVDKSLQPDSLPCDRWVVDFGGGNVCDMNAVRMVLDHGMELKTKQKISFQQSVPVLIRKLDEFFCQPIHYNFGRDRLRRTSVYVSDYDYAKAEQETESLSHFAIQPRLIAMYEKDKDAVTEIKSSTFSNDLSSVHLIVRVDDQQRNIQGDIPNFPGYIDNVNFEKYFGSNPTVITINGNPTRYYMSSKLDNDNLEKFVTCEDLGFMNVYERCFLIVAPHSEDEKRQAYGFTTDYIGSDLIYDPFRKMVEYVSKLKAEAVTTKMVHIVQSSGMGKTRICFQLLEHLKRGIYCVYRLSGSSGYPRTTPWFTELVNEYNGCNSDDDAVWACLKFIYLIVHYKFNIQNFKGEDVESNFLQFNNRCVDETIKMFRGHEQFAANVSDLAKNVKKGLLYRSLNIESLVSNIKAKVGNALFPIVFDECHELLITSATNPGVISLYRAIRRALGKLNETGIVGLFLGTKASLGDFTLNWRSDASRREATIDKIVPPYLLCDSLDVHLNREFVINYENSNQVVTIKDNEFYRSKALEDFALCCGRPLWKCYEFYCTAFDIAKSKISSEPELIDLAAILIRISAEFTPQDKLAHRLVLSGMATLLYVDLNGETCLSYYCPEPLLSNAARVHMHLDENFLKGLDQFLQRLHSGAFKNTGKAGEFVGRLILLRAFDKALIKYEKKPESSSETVHKSDAANNNAQDDTDYLHVLGDCLLPKLGLTKVREYLSGLTGFNEQDIVDDFELPNEIMSGFVTCCQFVPIKKDFKIDQLFLKHGYARCVGFQLFDNAPGSDVIIPVLRTDNKMSCIAIQLKNYSHKTTDFPNRHREVSGKLQTGEMKYLNFGECGEFPAVEDPDDFVRIVIQFQGKVASYVDVVDENDEPGKRSKRPKLSKEVCAWSHTKVANGKKKWILWLKGLDAFDHLLSFENKSLEAIREVVNKILSADRNYFEGIEFPKNVNIEFMRQCSRLGAETLYTLASPCANNEYLALYGAQGREIYQTERAALLEQFRQLNIGASAFKDRANFAVRSESSDVNMEG